MASYAIPLTGSGPAHGHHGHGHTRSQHRKTLFRPSTLQRIDSESIASQPTKGNQLSLNRQQSNGSAFAINHIHHHSQENGRVPSPLPSPSLAPNGHLDKQLGETDMLPSYQRSPIKAHFEHELESIALYDSRAGPATVTTDAPQRSRPSTDAQEIVMSLFLLLPYLLISILYFPQLGLDRNAQDPLAMIEKLTSSVLDENNVAPVTNYREPGILDASLYTSCVFILLGCLGKIKSMREPESGSQSGDSLIEAKADFMNMDMALIRRLLERYCGLALPFYASTKLGGGRVGMFLLLITATSHIKWRESKSDRTIAENWTWIKASPPLVPAVLGLFMIFDVFESKLAVTSILLGYSSLLGSILTLPSLFHRIDEEETPDFISSPLVSSKRETSLTLIAGGLLGAFSLVVAAVSNTLPTALASRAILLVAISGSMLCLFSSPSSLRTVHKFGLLIGLVIVCLGSQLSNQGITLPEMLLAACGYGAVQLDSGTWRKLGHHHHSHSKSHLHHEDRQPSILTRFLLNTFHDYPLVYSVLSKKDSRRICYFLTLNFMFMLIQLTYGFLTGSLGLLSDSIHMFFDCFGLLVGLCAAIMSRWPPNARFPYGYAKVGTLSGFANGIFLMIISVEIVYEAIERLSEGSELQRLNELLFVSFAGLLVNVVGMFSFEHAHHGHSHAGHDHSHGGDSNMKGMYLHVLGDFLGSVAVVVSTLLTKYIGWSGWDPIASCLIAVFIFTTSLPLIQDSASALLMSLPADVEYNLRDTLAGVSAIRGVVGYSVPKFWLDDSGVTSSHDHKDHGHDHQHHHHNHSEPDHSHAHTHSHSHDHHEHHVQPTDSHSHDEHQNPKVLGIIHVIASRVTMVNLEDVRLRTVQYLQERGMEVIVQVEREGDGRCWCGGGRRDSSAGVS